MKNDVIIFRPKGGIPKGLCVLTDELLLVLGLDNGPVILKNSQIDSGGILGELVTLEYASEYFNYCRLRKLFKNILIDMPELTNCDRLDIKNNNHSAQLAANVCFKLLKKWNPTTY